jgi:hypothetical protein
VVRQGLLVEGEIVPLNELEKSDWLEKLLHRKRQFNPCKNWPIRLTVSLGQTKKKIICGTRPPAL